MRAFIYAFCASLVLASFSCFAVEPANLHLAIQQLKQYHDTGAYDKDIERVNASALRYLKHRVAQANFHGKPAIVLDIDETSLSNYQDMEKMQFGGTIEQINQNIEKGTDPVIASTLKLYQYAKAHHVAVIFLTGRKENECAITAINLKNAGYSDWDKLILRSGEHLKDSATTYKTAMRKTLTNEGYDIILNIGDQHSDLVGGYSDKTFKLPNPYYFIG